MNKNFSKIKRNNKKILPAVAFLTIIFVWSILVYIYGPARINEIIGIKNSYIFIFIVSFLGGTSILFPFPYYLFVFTFGASGLNPYILGISAGLGLMIGDSTSYFVGYSGREIFSKKMHIIANKLQKWCLKRPPWSIPILLFFYGCFFPMPNDIIIVPFGAIRYPFVKVVIPIGLGNIVFNTLIAFAGMYGLNLFF